MSQPTLLNNACCCRFQHYGASGPITNVWALCARCMISVCALYKRCMSLVLTLYARCMRVIWTYVRCMNAVCGLYGRFLWALYERCSTCRAKARQHSVPGHCTTRVLRATTVLSPPVPTDAAELALGLWFPRYNMSTFCAKFRGGRPSVLLIGCLRRILIGLGFL